MNLYGISNLLAGIASLSMAIFLYIKGYKYRLTRIWAFFCLSVAIYGFGAYMATSAQNKQDGLFWWQISYIGVILIPFLFICFIYEFLNIRRTFFIKFTGVCTIIFLISDIFFKKLFIGDSNLLFASHTWFKPAYWVYPPGPMHIFFTVFAFIGWVTYAHIELIKFYKKTRGIKRNQIKYFFLATALGFAGGATSFLPCWGVFTYPIYNFTIPLFPIIMTCAIYRYHLMDINVALTRAGIFAIVYFFILGIPFWIGFRLLGMGLWLLPVTITAIFATIGPFIYQIFRRRAENFILKEQRYYQQILTNLSKSMINIRDLEHLLKTVSLTILQAVKVPFLAMYIKDDEHQGYRLKNCYPQNIESKFQEFIPFEDPLIEVLNKQKRPLFSEEAGHQDKIYLDSGLVIPCFGKEGLLAIIVLGAKPNGRMYTPDDLLVFENLSYSTSFAIENCIYWKEIENSQRLARIEEMNLFSYSLAHEIDNPMTIIIGNANKINKFYIDNMSLSEGDKKELKSTFDQISEAAWRVSGMVKAIQEFGEKTSGELKPINLKNTIATFLKLYTPHFKMNAVDFTMEVPEELPLIMGVSQEIEQVLVIFSNNAVHALLGVKDKKINLKVEVVNSHWIKIIFSDNGYGIPKGNLLTIFSAFVTTKASSEGTGMGLYNAKNIINRHNGKIWAESEGEGKGAKFIIELPIAKDIKPEEPKEEKKGSREY